MLYIIEGLPRCGKTTIANEISRRLQMPIDNSRHEGGDYDAFVLGKCAVHRAIDWRTTDLIMDSQLPRSYAYGFRRHSDNLANFVEADQAIPCVYFYIKVSDSGLARVSNSTSKDSYHSKFHSVDDLRVMDHQMQHFIKQSPNPSFFIELPDNPTQTDYDRIREKIIYHINNFRPDWPEYFMNVARQAARRSTCLSRHVGAVLVSRKNRILGVGYSGPPRGAEHCQTCNRRDAKSGELLHDSHAVHAEMNAVLNATTLEERMKIYCTTQPCFECTKMLINAGVTQMFYEHPYPDKNRDKLLMASDAEQRKI